jgi:protein-disulfide isomerase
MFKRKAFARYQLTLLSMLILTGTGYPQVSSLSTSSELGKPVPQPACGTISHEQADAIIEELKHIRRLLETEPSSSDTAGIRSQPLAQKHMKVASNWRSLGSPTAPVTIVEFADYQCPYCRAFHERIFPGLKADYIDTGKLLFVSVDSPLPFHANARNAAEAAQCAADQGKFWEMREALLEHNDKLSLDFLPGYARSLGLDIGVFESCLRDGRHRETVQQGIEQTRLLDIPGTPAFLISKSSTKELIGDVTFGVHSLYDFQSTIVTLLGSPSEQQPESALQPMETHGNRSPQ